MAKKKKNAIPKKLAGVKVPKFLRKSSLVKGLLKTEMGRDILANALTAGAGAAAAVLAQNRGEIAETAGDGAKKSVRIAGLATEAGQNAASAAMSSIADAAKAVLPGGAPTSSKSRKKAQRQNARH